jgi:aminoglycoside 6'-N-acetyltransferase
MGYLFRPVAEADLPLLAEWRLQPHVIRWWGPLDAEDAAEALAEGRVAMWIVEHEGRPFAYAQDYSPHDWDNHPFGHLPTGARGIDQYIGEPDMLDRGHGSAFVRAHVERLFAAGAPVIGTDPHPDNARAIRAYEKAGFVIASEPMDTRWGRAMLMECWR